MIQKVKNLYFYNLLYLVYQFFFKTSEFKTLILDYIETRSKLSKNIYQSKSNKKIALIAFNGILLNTKLELLLLLPYALNGYKIIVILRDQGNPWTKIYLKLLGKISFVNISKIELSPEIESEITNTVDYFKKQPIKFDSIKKWSYKDVLIGPTILSNIQRKNRLASPDLMDINTIKSIYLLLPEIIIWISKLKIFFENYDFEKIFTIEANDWNSPIISLAIKKNIDCIQVVQPFKDDSFVFKRINSQTVGVNPNSVSKSTLNQITGNQWTDVHEKSLRAELLNRYSGLDKMQARNQVKTIKFNKDELIKKIKLNPEKKIVCVFSHILWDANLFYGEDLYDDYSEWFLETVKIAINNPKVNWIIKLHPANVWKRQFEGEKSVLAELSLLKSNGIHHLPEQVKLLLPDTDIDTYSLFQLIDYAVTVRGTIGIELPCFGKWVITAGTGRYTDLGITKDPKTINEYTNILMNIDKFDEIFDESRIKIAKWHAYSIFINRPCKFKGISVNLNFKQKSILGLNMKFNDYISTGNEIFHGINKWYKFSQNTSKVDYLETDY